MNRDALIRIARRATLGAEQLAPEDRAQLFEDVSLILPKPEARVAKDVALSIRRTMRLQTDFLAALK